MDVGVIGTGMMGRNHVRVYSELKSVGSVGVFDVRAGSAEEIARQHGADACPTLRALLDACDAVSVCVPTPFHVDVVRQVFESGTSVLIEKPICASSAEAISLLSHKPAGITVGVGHIERFNPIVQEIRKIVDKPLYVEMKRHNPASARVSGSTVVEDLMIHDIDVLLSLFGTPSDIHSAGNVDVCSVLAKCGTMPVALSASRKSSKKIRMIYIEEEEFTIEGDFMTQEITIYRKPGQYQFEAERYVQENIIEKVMVNKLEPLKRELGTFIDCVRNKKPFPVTPEQAVENLRVCETILAGL
ncbi:Gfo/Idh/MocA family oxidoreductase [uncultured Methanoregula sp.]|uniref:Gfo/Idh/MocA family oxidoreductase n=1 Tax=uncultured Methanoregula sp. TaxID=1005933 RepID=UPI002AAA812C|nr:Gfo/Idh/MocA family oxidoreductase [uncultured Methanoregula sp.]